MELLNQLLMVVALIASFYIGKWLYTLAPQEVEYGRTCLMSALVVLWMVGCGILFLRSPILSLAVILTGIVGFFPTKRKQQKKGWLSMVQKIFRSGCLILLGIAGIVAVDLNVVSIAVVSGLIDGSLEKW